MFPQPITWPWRRTGRWLLAVALSCPLAAWETWALAGPGFGPLRNTPRQVYGSLEIDHWLSAKRYGVWAAVDSSPSGGWVGLGPLLAVPVGNRYHLAISSGPGWFPNRGRFDLGSPLEFRTTAYATARLPNGWEAGITLSHYSNGGTAKHNPGAETIRLVLAVPLSH